MKVNKNKIWFFTLFTIYINVYQPISVYPQYPDSLNHYLDIAVKNNPVVLQKYAEYQAALEKVPQAAALPDPELSAGIFLSPMELLMGRQVANLKLMQMFPWFGTLSAARDEMSLMAKAGYEGFIDAKLQLVYDVQKSWYEMQRLKREVEITRDNVDILKSLERIYLTRFRTPATAGISGSSAATDMTSASAGQSGNLSSGMQGMGGGGASTVNSGSSSTTQPGTMQGESMRSGQTGTGLSDLYNLQAEIMELENKISLLESQMRTSRAKFNSYLNRLPESEVTLQQKISEILPDIDLNNALDTILMYNPMLAMADLERQSLEARSVMAKRMGYPMIGLGIDYSVIEKSEMSESAMNGKDMLMPMVTLTLPLNRNKYNALKNEAGQLLTAKNLEYDAIGNSLRAEYYEAVELLDDSRRRFELAEKQTLLSTKSSEILVKNFSASGTGLSDILQVRRQILDYEINRTDALKDYYTALAWIERLGY